MIAAVIAAVALGVVAGLRTFLAPAALGWAARSGALDLDGTALHWLGGAWAPWMFTALAIAELAGDKSSRATSRKALPALSARLLSGGFCGAALGMGGNLVWPASALVGMGGAWLGTFAGHGLRTHLAGRIGKDWPAALLEDGLAIALAGSVVAGWAHWT